MNKAVVDVGRSAPEKAASPSRVVRYGIVLSIFWTVLAAGSLIVNLIELKNHVISAAQIQARSALEKDVLYRRWNSMHGGVYVPVTEQTPPNPYLNVPEREITTASGRLLTKMNPAYMTRQVHELGKRDTDIQGHITSLKPLRPENAPDVWEKGALESFDRGEAEVATVVDIDGKPYMRLMQPLITEPGCLTCHESQGYKVGDIRGGLSVSVPMETYDDMAQARTIELIIAHAILWAIGLAGIGLGTRRVHRDVQERERLVGELEQALSEVKTLGGMLPICASCKKIRDDQGFWNQVESYIESHTDASFTHGICPECVKKLYPELADRQSTE